MILKLLAKKFFYALLVLCGLWGLLGASTAMAQDFDCSDPRAKWNIDYTTWPFLNGVRITNYSNLSPLFSCQSVPESNITYTFINPCASGGRTNTPTRCEGSADCATCPSGQRCARQADCESIGGYCLPDNHKDGPKISDVSCQTGVTQNLYTFLKPVTGEKLGPSYWQLIRFRCGKGNTTTCWKPVMNLGSATGEAEAEPDVNLPPAPDVPTMTVSDCCRQIVPSIDYKTQDYTLNHLVQTAINVYECILCIVGSLILIMLIFGAVMMMVSAGNEAMVGKGKQIIGAAVVGGLIVFFSFLIVNFTVKALGAQFSNENKVEIKPQG